MWILLSCLLLILLVYRTRKNSRGRIGPVGLPFLKDTVAVLIDQRPQRFSQLFEKYGDTVYEEDLGGGFVSTRDPDVAHFVYSNVDLFVRKTEKSRVMKATLYFNSFFGSGIFAADGESWTMQRAFSSPLFRKNSLDKMIAIFQHYGEIVLDVMEESANAGSSLDIQDLFNRYTMDSFGEIGFGVVFNSVTDHNPFPLAFDTVQGLIIPLTINPYNWYFPNKEFFGNLEYMHDYVERIIQTRRALSIDELDMKNDLLSRFVSKQDEAGFSNEFLRDLIMNFIIAGKDTTAQLLTWMSYNLSFYPEMAEKLRLEISQQFDGNFTRENINKMKYLDCFLHETLRLFPSVPRTGRRASKDIELPDGTMVYENETVMIDMFSIHRNPKYWDNPEEFNPDRWIESPIKNPWQFVPFYGGPMVCLGKHLAIAEVKTMMILMIQRYNIELTQDIEPINDIIYKSKNGVHTRLHKVNDQ